METGVGHGTASGPEDVEEVVSKTTFSHLPDSVLHNLLGVLVEAGPLASSYAPFHLRGQSLGRAQEAHALSLTCRRARNIFRNAVASLHIEWDDIVGVGVVGFFAPALRSLVVNRHAQSCRFVQAIQENSACLVKLHLYRCPVDHLVLAEAVATCAPTLKDFALHFVNSVDTVAGGATPWTPRSEACSSKSATTMEALVTCYELENLSLHGLPDLEHASLVSVLRSLSELRSLSLGYLRHQSIGSDTLAQIGRSCKNLDSLHLYDTRWAPVSSVVNLCEDLGKKLRALQLHSVAGLTDAELDAIVRICPNLISLSVRCDERGFVTGGAIVSAVKALSPNLMALEISGETIAGFSDEELHSIIVDAPCLQSLNMRHADVTDVGLFMVADSLANTLRSIDVGGRFISDRGLIALAQCQHLENFSLTIVPSIAQFGVGAIAFFPPPVEGGARRPIAVSNVGIEELLRGCGRNMRRFQIVNLQPSGLNYRRHGVLGSQMLSNLACAGVFRSLAHHCSRRLLVVSLQKLTPPLSARRERGHMDLGMLELEDVCPDCVVWADREAPPNFPFSVDELLPDTESVD